MARILQITSYPPPRAGWGVRVEFLKKRLEQEGHCCTVLNVGRSRTIPSPEYETVAGGLDYCRKVWRFSRAGYVAHVHTNGDSEKGFVLALLAELLNLLAGKRCYLTFHAGVEQIYFPRPKYPLLWPMFWLMFAIPRRIICNSEAVKVKIREYGVPAQKIVPIPAFTRQYLEFRQVPLAPPVEAFYRRFPTVIFTYIRIRTGFYLDTLLEGFARLARSRPDVGLAFCGVSGDIDEALWRDVEGRIRRYGLADRICVIDDLGHDEFRVALTRASLYLRTPTTDGVASSVLEALALGVPVVASENGTRPPGVVTYRAADAVHLAEVVAHVIDRLEAVVAGIPKFDVPDTLLDELRVLTSDDPAARAAVPKFRPDAT
jgi:glycosyltransferase involved in cell wall biosynthesis